MAPPPTSRPGRACARGRRGMRAHRPHAPTDMLEHRPILGRDDPGRHAARSPKGSPSGARSSAPTTTTVNEATSPSRSSSLAGALGRRRSARWRWRSPRSSRATPSLRSPRSRHQTSLRSSKKLAAEIDAARRPSRNDVLRRRHRVRLRHDRPAHRRTRRALTRGRSLLPAVHPEGLARAVARRIRCEEQHRIRDLFGSAHSPDRVAGSEYHVVRLLLARRRPVVALGLHRAARDRVHADAPGGPRRRRATA